MKIENNEYLNFDQVLIKPRQSYAESRKVVSLIQKFYFENSGNHMVCLPIMVANMDSIGTFEIANILEKYDMVTCLHKHYSVEDLYEYFFTPRPLTVYSMGITEADLTKWNNLKSKLPVGNIQTVCIDVANGYLNKFESFISKFRKNNPKVTIIAGNVVTPEAVERLYKAGADVVKIGIGPGSVCTTRIQTGVGVPQLSAIIECSEAAKLANKYIIGDGGCTTPGDVAKGFAAGASFMMLGGMFAGHEECAGDTITKDGKLYKSFYGMSSKRANDTYNGGLSDYKSAEGKEVLIPFKGSIENTIQNITGGIRSTCTYVGAFNLNDLYDRTIFIKVNATHNKIYEN